MGKEQTHKLDCTKVAQVEFLGESTSAQDMDAVRGLVSTGVKGNA